MMLQRYVFLWENKRREAILLSMLPLQHKTINKKLLSEVKSRDTMGEIPALRKNVWFLSDKQ